VLNSLVGRCDGDAGGFENCCVVGCNEVVTVEGCVVGAVDDDIIGPSVGASEE